MIAAIESTEQGTQEWLEARLSGVGGSEVAALMGANPYATPLDVWMAKVMPGDGTQSVPMKVGHALEPFIAGLWLAEHEGWTLAKPPALIRHPEVSCAIASLDYLAHRGEESIVLEIKSTQQDWLSVPERVWWQVQWQLACTGLERAEVAALVRNRDLRVYFIQADTVAQADALDRVQRFWSEHVLTETMPDLDPVRDNAALDRLWTPEPAKQADVPGELVRTWLDLKAAAAALRTDIEEIEGRIKIAMADATEGLVEGQRVLTWREVQGRRVIDADALKRDGLHEQYLKQGKPYRSLRSVRTSS